jgi:hypothetical protein
MICWFTLTTAQSGLCYRGLAEVIYREICIISIIGDGHNQISIVPKEKQGKIYLGHVNDQHYYSLRPKDWNHIWYKGNYSLFIFQYSECRV